MHTLITEFEIWLKSNNLTEDEDTDYWVVSPSVHATFQEVQDKWYELKKRYLDAE